MAEETGISWADSTFNGWIGCTKVGPGCDHCYAEADFDHRKHRVTWGAGQARSRTSPANWNKPRQWEREHAAFFSKHGRQRRVFGFSLGDVFDNEVPRSWRDDQFALIRDTPHLYWLLVTKRVSNVAKMCPDGLPDNVWLGATMVNRSEFLRDLPKLKATRARVRFISAEPLLEDIGDVDLRGIDWLIAGGESGPHARPMEAEWVRNLQRLCARDGVAFHFKQWGGRGKDKGGCLLDGQEQKAFPRAA